MDALASCRGWGLTLYSLTFSIAVYVTFTVRLRYQLLHVIKGVYRTDRDGCAETWLDGLEENLETHGKRGRTIRACT